MRSRTLMIALAVAGVLGAAGYGLYSIGMDRGMKMGGTADAGGGAQQAGAVDPATGRRVLYWHDPMVPGQKFDKPGKSPFMDMQLVPVYADSDADQGTVSVNSRMQQNLCVRTALVSKGTLGAAVEAVGSVAYNDRDVALLQA